MIFLKLGGSLITDKDSPETARVDVLRRLAIEIRQALAQRPDLRLLIGHGSGSFGHSAASRFGTHQGAGTPEEWVGFAEVWAVANRLHRLVVDELRQAGLPAMGFPPSASAVAEDGALISLAIEPIDRALREGLIPVVAGDVAFDRVRGTTILSTERVFAYLAPRLQPERLLLAGIEAGVFADFPANSRLMATLTRTDLAAVRVGAAAAPDVTGGMGDKVRQALDLVEALPQMEALIFSAEQPGRLQAALSGESPGTRLLAGSSPPG